MLDRHRLIRTLQEEKYRMSIDRPVDISVDNLLFRQTSFDGYWIRGETLKEKQIVY